LRGILLSIQRCVAIGKFDAHMTPVAERLVRGGATAAEGNAVTDFVGMTIGRYDRNVTPHPQRATTALMWFLDNSDRRFEFRLKWPLLPLVPHHQTS
jgi:hypothetical protein